MPGTWVKDFHLPATWKPRAYQLRISSLCFSELASIKCLQRFLTQFNGVNPLWASHVQTNIEDLKPRRI
ncbi:hypothetical protein AAZX31_17G140600 [Glycine max]